MSRVKAVRLERSAVKERGEQLDFARRSLPARSHVRAAIGNARAGPAPISAVIARIVPGVDPQVVIATISA